MNPVNLHISRLRKGSNFFRIGLPLPKGTVKTAGALALYDCAGHPVSSVITDTAHWPDGSVKWCLIKASIAGNNSDSTTLTIRSSSENTADTPTVTTVESEAGIVIHSGPAEFQFTKGGNNVFPNIIVSGQNIWNADHNQASLTLEDNSECPFIIEETRIEEQDALTATCVVSGSYQLDENRKLNAKFNFEIYPNAQLKLVCELHNPQRATHPGGIWDLGDPGSITFKDHSILLGKEKLCNAELRVESSGSWVAYDQPVALFQASSGGDNWDSPTHINAKGGIANKFRGYQLSQNDKIVADGNRSQPTLALTNDNHRYTINIKNFWQNFPKSIDISESEVALRLYPHQHNDAHEIQGGERKTHDIFFDFNPADTQQWSEPLPKLDTSTYKNSRVFRYFDNDLEDEAYDKLIAVSLDESKGMLAKREAIDEFGWRNFGEVYADHEGDQHNGDELFVSHYNNQYDGIAGFIRQYALTGNTEWYQLMSELAEHVMDIDIYHTEEDRIEYNKGLFWHTDHYAQAKTSTHRTFSASQLDDDGNPPRGGGPGPQHCYSTGLTQFHYMTGHEGAKDIVLGLAEWMQYYFEGTGTLIETAKKTLQSDSKKFVSTCKGNKVFKYTYPMDRGTGNYLRVFMDCFDLTADPRYLQHIEHIIHSTAGPTDEINARGFDDIEANWYYVIYLQELIRYMDLKRSLDQFDSTFYYARSTLLHYAKWMVENEKPYLHSSEILEHPNATWIAQEPRRMHVLYAAYRYALKDRSVFLDKARFFREYFINELAQSDTLHYARIQALLLQNHGPSAQLNVDHLPYPGLRDVSVTEETDCFHTPASHLKQIAGTWVTSLCKFRIKKELGWIKARAS